MPRPPNVSRVSILGHQPGGEIFDTSFWLDDVPTGQDEANTWATGIAALLQAHAIFPNLKSYLAVQGGYDLIKVYSYPSGTGGANVIGEGPLTGGAGTGNSGNGLLTTALVTTLRTGAAGRRNRGRMYWPASGVAAAAGQCDAGVADNLSSQLASFFSDVNGAPAGVGTVCVVSTVGASRRPVTQVSCDTKFDLQRRRANRLAASHSHTANV